MEKAYFEDCRVGDSTVTCGRTVTETDIVMFAALTGDWNLPHTNVEYAKGTTFGERIAHGVLILAIGGGLFSREGVSALLPKSLIALAGIEKIRFVAPTKIGDTIHLESEVAKMTEISEERGLIMVKHRMVNQRGKSVLTYTSKFLALRRSS